MIHILRIKQTQTPSGKVKAEAEITEIKLFTHGTGLKCPGAKCHAGEEIPGLSN